MIFSSKLNSILSKQQLRIEHSVSEIGVLKKNLSEFGQSVKDLEKEHDRTLKEVAKEIDALKAQNVEDQKRQKDISMKTAKIQVEVIADKEQFIYENGENKREVEQNKKKITSIEKQINEFMKDSNQQHVEVQKDLTTIRKEIVLKNECEMEKFNMLNRYIETQLKELSQILNHMGNRKAHLKALFLVQVAETWPSIASIWEAFENDPLWDAKIVVMPFYHPYMEGENISGFLVDNGISFERSECYDIDKHIPDIVFYQEPYDSTQPEHYQVRQIVDKGYRVGYSSYSVELGGSPDLIRFQFNLDMQNLAWRVFCRSERHKKMYGKYCASGNNHVIVTGHPKFDMLKNYQSDEAQRKLREIIKGRKTIIWNPHFCLDPDNQYSTFLIFKDSILDYFTSHPDMFLILRPHPMLYMYLTEHEFMTQGELEVFFEDIKAIKNIYLDKSSTYQWVFHISDAMISDISSFVIEYLATEKPLLFTQAEKSPLLNDDGSIQNYHYCGRTKEQIVSFLDMINQGKDPMKEERLKIIPEYLFGLDGLVGERIKDYVTENILAEEYLKEKDVMDKIKALLNEVELVNKVMQKFEAVV